MRAAARRVAHSSERPSHGSPVSVAQRLPLADADDQLDDLAGDAPIEMTTSAERGDEQPRPPLGHVVVLHAAGHAHQAEHSRAA